MRSRCSMTSTSGMRRQSSHAGYMSVHSLRMMRPRNVVCCLVMRTCELQKEVGTHVTELTSIEAISVKPCMTGCYLVTLSVNGQKEEQLHVFADNPYHAVNRKIKDICESYGTTRGELGYGRVTY